MSFFDFNINNVFPPVNGAQLLNETLVLAATITDDDLRFGADVQVDWPTVSTRLNNCTVRFRNEAENFKEDSVSWPPKKTQTDDIGIGGRTYPVSAGWGTDANGAFLSAVGVWETVGNTVTLNWLIKPKLSGIHSLKIFLSGPGTVTLNGIPQAAGVSSVVLVAHVVSSISISCTDAAYPRGVAATLTDATGVEWWSTREPSYTAILVKNVTSAVYDAMMVEDSGVALETDVFLEGVTDYYHALASAESLVRTSRSALVVSFEMIFKNIFLEPGDYVRIISERLQLGVSVPFYVKVDEVSMKDTLVCSVKATRFDWTQLAWNVKDYEYLKPAKQYNFEVAAPAALYFTASTGNSMGTLTWPSVNDSSVVDYVLYVNATGSNDIHGVPLFQEVGRATQSPFVLPALTGSQFNFGVKSHTSNNRYSAMTVTDCNAPVEVLYGTPPQATNLVATSSSTKAKVSLSWEMPGQRADGSPYDDHLVTTVWRSVSNSFASAGKIGESVSETFDDIDEVYTAMYYWVRLTSNKGRSGPESSSVTATFSHHGGAATDATPPIAPYDLAVVSGYSILYLDWTIPSYTTGGGHAYCNVYAAKKIGASAPLFAEATLYERCYANSTIFTGGSAETWYFWISNVSKGGGESVPCAPAFGTTAIDIAATMAALEGQITASALHTDLGTRIDLIDAPATGLVTKTDTAITNAGTALSTANTAVATANGASSSVSTLASLTAGPSGNTATYTVKVDANGYVAGYGLSSSSNGEGGVSSAFLMRVDRFAVGSPGAGWKYPFIIDSGVTYIDNAMIKDATITNAKIANATIDAAKIASINADTITAGTITGRTIRTSTDGTRIELKDGVSGSDPDTLIGYSGGSPTWSFTAGRSSSSRADLEFTGGALLSILTNGMMKSTANGNEVSLGGYLPIALVGNYTGWPTVIAIAHGANTNCITANADGGASNGVYSAGTNFDFYAAGSGTNYGPFTGAHEILLGVADGAVAGDIVVDSEVLIRRSLSNVLTKGQQTSAANQKAVVGVLTLRAPLTVLNAPPSLVLQDLSRETTPMPVIIPGNEGFFEGAYDYAHINSLGEGVLNVCGQAGDLVAGDLIVASDVPGKGMRQSDDIVRSYTVAKSRESVTFSSPSEVKQVACIYLCG